VEVVRGESELRDFGLARSCADKLILAGIPSRAPSDMGIIVTVAEV